jgi:hypothetical protein
MDQPPYVPTVRLLGPLFLSLAWAVEFIATIVLIFSRGQFPKLDKYFVVLTITILASFHKVIYRRQSDEQQTSSVPTLPQIFLIITLIVGYAGIALWLFADML